MGFDEETAQKMYLAGALHDIGKVAVGNEILEKPGRLTDEEFAEMKHHAAYTYYILSEIEDFEELRDWAGSGAIDCAIAGQSITAKRLESVDFTDPYYYASIVTLVKKDGPYKDAKGLADLKGATATSQINTVWYDTCLDQIEDVNKLPAYETTGTMLVSLESGACDLICTDQPTAMAACVAYPDMEMLDFSSSDDNYQVSDEEINIGISVKKGNQELVDEINSVLEKMTKEDYEQMMNEAISVQPLSE